MRTRRPIVTFKRFDIVRVYYPLTDQAKTKLRPALVLSTKEFNLAVRHVVMAMITTSRLVSWPGDTEIKDMTSAGLPKPSLMRMKIFTLDQRFIEDRLGELAEVDRASVEANLSAVLRFS